MLACTAKSNAEGWPSLGGNGHHLGYSALENPHLDSLRVQCSIASATPFNTTIERDYNFVNSKIGPYILVFLVFLA